MKHAKKFFALLLCAALLAGLAVPAFADTPEFAITADKKMVATGETITLTAVNAPQAGAGQWLEYRWYLNFLDVHGAMGGMSLGTTTDASTQIQAPGMDLVKPSWTNPFSQRFSTTYWCVVDVRDASGPIASYTTRRIEILGYYSLKDSFAVPYEYLGYALISMIAQPFSGFFQGFACLFGFLWSPFVALANQAEARRLNG